MLALSFLRHVYILFAKIPYTIIPSNYIKSVYKRVFIKL